MHNFEIYHCISRPLLSTQTCDEVIVLNVQSHYLFLIDLFVVLGKTTHWFFATRTMGFRSVLVTHLKLLLLSDDKYCCYKNCRKFRRRFLNATLLRSKTKFRTRWRWTTLFTSTAVISYVAKDSLERQGESYSSGKSKIASQPGFPSCCAVNEALVIKQELLGDRGPYHMALGWLSHIIIMAEWHDVW